MQGRLTGLSNQIFVASKKHLSSKRAGLVNHDPTILVKLACVRMRIKRGTIDALTTGPKRQLCNC